MTRKGIEDFYSVPKSKSKRDCPICKPSKKKGAVPVEASSFHFLPQEFAEDLAAALNLGREIRMRRKEEEAEAAKADTKADTKAEKPPVSIKSKQIQKLRTFGDLNIGDKFYWKDTTSRDVYIKVESLRVQRMPFRVQYPSGLICYLEAVKSSPIYYNLESHCLNQKVYCINDVPERSEGTEACSEAANSQKPLTYDDLSLDETFTFDEDSSDFPLTYLCITCRKLSDCEFSYSDSHGNPQMAFMHNLGNRNVERTDLSNHAPTKEEVEGCVFLPDLPVGCYFKLDRKDMSRIYEKVEHPTECKSWTIDINGFVTHVSPVHSIGGGHYVVYPCNPPDFQLGDPLAAKLTINDNTKGWYENKNSNWYKNKNSKEQHEDTKPNCPPEPEICFFKDLKVGEWFKKPNIRLFVYYKDDKNRCSQHFLNKDGNPGKIYTTIPNMNAEPWMAAIKYTPPMCQGETPLKELPVGSYFVRSHLMYASNRSSVYRVKSSCSSDHDKSIQSIVCTSRCVNHLNPDELVTPINKIRARDIQEDTLFIRAAKTGDDRLYHRKQDGSVGAYGPKCDGAAKLNLQSSEVVEVVNDQFEEVYPRNGLV